MKLLVTSALLMMAANQTFAAPKDKLADPALTPIKNMFDAMREHDSDKFSRQFMPNALLQRAEKDNTVSTSDLTKFATFIGETEKHLDEQLFNVKLHQSGNVASAWTPFAFYLDGKLSHCGINSFQLVKQDDAWKIQYLIDNAHVGDCETFIAKHKSL